MIKPAHISNYFLNYNAMHFETSFQDLSAIGIIPTKQLKPPNHNNPSDFNQRNKFIWLQFET